MYTESGNRPYGARVRTAQQRHASVRKRFEELSLKRQRRSKLRIRRGLKSVLVPFLLWLKSLLNPGGVVLEVRVFQKLVQCRGLLNDLGVIVQRRNHKNSGLYGQRHGLGNLLFVVNNVAIVVVTHRIKERIRVLLQVRNRLPRSTRKVKVWLLR